jgi:death on curing protein
MIMIYPDINKVLQIHDKIIEISGGGNGVRDIGMLESVLNHVQNDNYYPTFLDKLTHLVFSINKNHSFIDGNKRSCIGISCYFLNTNGFEYALYSFIFIMEDVAIGIADNIISKDELQEMLKKILDCEEFTEDQKFLIMKSKEINYKL